MQRPSVAFATACWEKDWRQILLDDHYLAKKQIGNHCFDFAERILVLNNVKEKDKVRMAAKKRVEEGILTRVVEADEEVLGRFGLKRSDFRVGEDVTVYGGVNHDWIYYNALAPLSAIDACQSEYLLYLTGDVRLEIPIDWVGNAICHMERDGEVKVANLTWNHQYQEARREAEEIMEDFYCAKEGFSDQMFLVRSADFKAPIYGEIREDSGHFPRGDVFEKRVFSYMKNRGWKRITYRWGSYIHENF